MNIIENFLLKAKVSGAEHDVAELQEQLRMAQLAQMKAECEAAELRDQLKTVDALKCRYQAALVDIIAVMERHGLVV